MKTLAMLEKRNTKQEISHKRMDDVMPGIRNNPTYMPSNSKFSSTEGALKLRTNSPYSVMSRFRRRPPLQSRKTPA